MFFEGSNQSGKIFAKACRIMVPKRIGDDRYSDEIIAQFLEIEIEFGPIATGE